MTYVLATSGGFSDTMSRSAFTTSENDGSVMDRTLTTENGMLSREDDSIVEVLSNYLGTSSTAATAGSSPDVNSVAGTSSTLEEHNGIPRASHNFDFVTNDSWGESSSSVEGQNPPENMLAASTTSSSTMALESGANVVETPLNGASHQFGNEDAGSSTDSTGLPELSSGDDWRMDHEGVQAFMREHMAGGSSTTMTEDQCIDPRFLLGGADNSANMTANTVPASPLAGPAQPAANMDADMSINNDALPPVHSGHLVGEAQPIGPMGVDNGANYQSAAQQTHNLVDEYYASTSVPAAMQSLPASTGSSATPMTGPAQNNVSFDGYAQQPQQTGPGSSVNNPVAYDATPSGFDQSQMYMGVDNSVNNSVAYDATLSGFNQPQMQNCAGNGTTNLNFAASSATPSGNMPPHTPIGAGNSTYNFGRQQYNFAGGVQQVNVGDWPANVNSQQSAPNGGFQGFNPQLNAAPQAKHGAVNTMSHNGIVGQYPPPPAYATGPAAGNWAGQQQQQQPDFSSNVPPYSGQCRQVAATQLPCPFAAVRTRRREGDANTPRKRRRTGAAPAEQALIGPAGSSAPAQQQIPAQQQVLVHQQTPVEQQASVKQQVPAQEGPHTYTANGVPNRDPTRPGNAQGQTPHWGPAFKHHNTRCDRFKLDGCVPDCELRLRWPLTWADWNSRRFSVRWEGRPETEIMSGFAVYAQKKKGGVGLVVLGEIQADGSVSKKKPVLQRVDKEAVKD